MEPSPAEPSPVETVAGAPGPVFFLPTARSLIAAGFGLLRAAQPELRRGSMYIGLLALLVAGPAAVFTVLLATRDPDSLAIFFGLVGPEEAAAQGSNAGSVVGILVLAGVGLVAVSLEAQIMGVAMLASRHVGRPMTVFQALRRSRQVFWRVLIASALLGAIGFAVGLVAGPAIRSVLGSGPDADAVLSSAVGIVFGIPFAYLTAGIVIGDVGPFETFRRSVRLARARPRLALVIAAFATAVSVIQTFAISAGGDILLRVADVLHLGFESGLVAALVSVGLILAAVIALGSLTFTIGAVAAAPQVVAFIGLTHHSAGLDQARLTRPARLEPATGPAAGPAAEQSAEPRPAPLTTGWDQPPPAPRATGLVTISMVGLALIEALAAMAGISRLPPA